MLGGGTSKWDQSTLWSNSDCNCNEGLLSPRSVRSASVSRNALFSLERDFE